MKFHINKSWKKFFNNGIFQNHFLISFCFFKYNCVIIIKQNLENIIIKYSYLNNLTGKFI